MFIDAMSELYCHLRQIPDIPRSLLSEMDIELEVFNKETDFFGDMLFDTRRSDMLCDGKNQYQNYSVLKNCPMWDEWLNDLMPRIQAEIGILYS